MPATLKTPALVLKTASPAPSIEINSDAITGHYADGAWETLLGSFTAAWLAKKAASGKPFAKSATVWAWGSPSCNFGAMGYSVFIAQYGLPMSYFIALQTYLAQHLGHNARFASYVQPSLAKGWSSRLHVQDGQVWQPLDEELWQEVVVAPQK